MLGPSVSTAVVCDRSVEEHQGKRECMAINYTGNSLVCDVCEVCSWN